MINEEGISTSAHKCILLEAPPKSTIRDSQSRGQLGALRGDSSESSSPSEDRVPTMLPTKKSQREM